MPRPARSSARRRARRSRSRHGISRWISSRNGLRASPGSRWPCCCDRRRVSTSISRCCARRASPTPSIAIAAITSDARCRTPPRSCAPCWIRPIASHSSRRCAPRGSAYPTRRGRRCGRRRSRAPCAMRSRASPVRGRASRRRSKQRRVRCRRKACRASPTSRAGISRSCTRSKCSRPCGACSSRKTSIASSRRCACGPCARRPPPRAIPVRSGSRISRASSASCRHRSRSTSPTSRRCSARCAAAATTSASSRRADRATPTRMPCR